MLDVLSRDIIGQIVLYGYVIAIGLCMGSFSTAIADRSGTALSWIRQKNGKAARSRCPHCTHQLAWFDLLPVVSWLWLRGSCRYCSHTIPAIYPMMEFLGAGILFMAIWVNGVSWISFLLLLLLPFCLAALFLVFRERAVPYFMQLSLVGSVGLSLCAIYQTLLWVGPAIVALCYVYSKRANWKVSGVKALFFVFWMNLMVGFCKTFTFHL